MREPDRMSVQLGDDHPIADDLQPLQPRLDGGRIGRIAELVEQARDVVGIVDPRVADQRA